MQVRWIFSMALFLLLVLPASATSRPPEKGPTPSPEHHRDNVPQDFVLLDAEGNTIYPPSGAADRPTVLWFWSIYDDSCGKAMLTLKNMQEKSGTENLLVLAINEDTGAGTERISRFLERFEKFRGKIPYPVLFDQKQEILEIFGLSSSPALVLLDAGGRIIGTYPGFDPAQEGELARAIDQMTGAAGDTGMEGDPGEDRSETMTVTGKASLCGFFESGVWRKAFTGNNDKLLELEKARDLARREAARMMVVSTLEKLRIFLLAEGQEKSCVDGRGIHLARDPLGTEDPLGNLIARISFPDFFHTVSEEERILGNTVYFSRTFRVRMDRFADFLQSLGYTMEPSRVRLRYVNLTFLDHREFITALKRQSLFVGGVEDLETGPDLNSQVLEIYTDPINLAGEISSMESGRFQLFTEEVTPDSMDVEFW